MVKRTRTKKVSGLFCFSFNVCSLLALLLSEWQEWWEGKIKTEMIKERRKFCFWKPYQSFFLQIALLTRYIFLIYCRRQGNQIWCFVHSCQQFCFFCCRKWERWEWEGQFHSWWSRGRRRGGSICYKERQSEEGKTPKEVLALSFKQDIPYDAQQTKLPCPQLWSEKKRVIWIWTMFWNGCEFCIF